MNERQIAEKIVKVLDTGVDSIAPEIVASLKATRQRAVAAMPALVNAMETQPALAGWGRVLEFSHHGGYRFWLPVLLLLVVLMAMLTSTMTSNNNQPIDADALLLASDLPPEAYADKEFVAWLENTSHL
jgi:hypothetical protein